MTTALAGLSGEEANNVVRKALNDTTRELHRKMIREIPNYVDRPRPITARSLYARYASGTKLEAGIEFKSYLGKGYIKQHWLWAMVHGGSRRDKGLERALRTFNMLPAGYMAIPTKDVRTDGYGNVPGGYVTAILSYLRTDMSNTQNRPAGKLNRRQWTRQIRRQKRFFIVQIGQRNPLPPGIYEYRGMASGRATRRVFDFKPVSYRATFPFYDIAMRFSRETLFKRIEERFKNVMDSRAFGGGE